MRIRRPKDHICTGWREFRFRLRVGLRQLWDTANGRRTIMYAGWIPGKPEDRRKWRKLGVGGPMYWVGDADFDLVGPGRFEHCEVTPKVMQRLLDNPDVDVPDTFTAYWAETDENLPRERQLWGGAPVQLCPP